MKKNCILSALVFIAGILTAQNNIQWRGTDRTGNYYEKNLQKSWFTNAPKLLWHYNGLGEGHSSVAIDSEKIYLSGLINKKGFIYVFDLNGKLLNKKEYGPEWAENYNGPRGTLTINEGKIYLISGVGNLYCFDQNTLKVIWEKNILSEFGASNIRWGINEAPLIIGDMIIATPGGKKHNVVALNKNSGDLIWSSPGEGDNAAYCSPIYISDQQVPQIVTMTANHIIGIDAATGEKLWSHKNTNRWSVHANTPVYYKNMILCTSGYGKGSTMLKLTNGGRKVEVAWVSSDLDSRIGAMVRVGDYVYGSGDNNKFWFCVDWNTGEIKWKNKDLAIGNVIANDGFLYCYTEKGDMVLVKATPQKFEMTGKFKITLGTEQHWAHPVIYKGVLYVRHGNTLMAYNIK